jgi:hypothetical protein
MAAWLTIQRTRGIVVPYAQLLQYTLMPLRAAYQSRSILVSHNTDIRMPTVGMWIKTSCKVMRTFSMPPNRRRTLAIAAGEKAHSCGPPPLCKGDSINNKIQHIAEQAPAATLLRVHAQVHR